MYVIIMNIIIDTNVSVFRCLFFVPYASEVKISGAENKLINVILYYVHCCALHWTVNKNFNL